MSAALVFFVNAMKNFCPKALNSERSEEQVKEMFGIRGTYANPHPQPLSIWGGGRGGVL